MNRRSFLESILKGAAAFSILPAATTYKRTWWKDRGLWTCKAICCDQPVGEAMIWQLTFDIERGGAGKWEQVAPESIGKHAHIAHGWAISNTSMALVMDVNGTGLIPYEEFTKLRRGEV